MTVKQKQNLLAYLGYYNGAVDGAWGRLSTDACRRFQQDFGGIAVDGNPGPETQKALKHAVTYGMPVREAEESVTDTNIGCSDDNGAFWDEVSEFFNREEFKCKCGGKYCNGYPAEPKEKLVRIAYQLRKNLGVPVTIVSGLRCERWNAIQGGVANSQHIYGEAVDIYARGISQARVEAELDAIGGVRYHYSIAGSSNVHFDIPKEGR